MENSEKVLVYVNINSLILTKSGDKKPKNIADFMPDYNLWYALKFMSPDLVILVSNNDLLSIKESITETETRLKFISIWFKQMTSIDCTYVYSIKGDWRPYFSDDSNILFNKIYGQRKYWKKMFIDSENEDNQDIIKSLGIDYIKVSKFISIYNKSPRIYKKSD